MLILAIDTSTRSGSLAVLRGEMPLAAVASLEQEPHSSGLFRSLSAVLGELRLDLHQIELFAVAAGPGSLSGVGGWIAPGQAWVEGVPEPDWGLSPPPSQAGPTQKSGGALGALFGARR